MKKLVNPYLLVTLVNNKYVNRFICNLNTSNEL